MSQVSTTPLADKIVPARNAAKKATTSFTEQLLSSPGDRSDDPPSSPFGEPLQSRAKVTKTYGRGRLKAADHAIRLSQPTSKKFSKPVARGSSTKKGSRKRAMTPSELSDTDDSAGTDPLIIISSDHPESPAAKANSKARRHTLSSIPPLHGPSTDRPIWPGTPSSVSRIRKVLPEKWDLSRLDTFVWVSVKKNGSIARHEGVDDDGHPGENMWWPAKVGRFRRFVSSSHLFIVPEGAEQEYCDQASSRHSLWQGVRTVRRGDRYPFGTQHSTHAYHVRRITFQFRNLSMHTSD